MADIALALVEESFFETPLDVAEELAELIKPLILGGVAPLVVDACAGTGVLGAAALNATGRIGRVSFIETNAGLLRSAISRVRGYVVGPTKPLDVFSREAEEIIRSADLVMMNPPFAGIRGEHLSGTLSSLQNFATYPDIGCQYFIHLARIIRPGVPLGFVFRRNAFLSRSYQNFWTELENLGTIIVLKDIQRRLRPSSGAAEAVIGVFVAGSSSHRCWLKQRSSQNFERQGQLLRRGWRRLGDVARVRAGPSIKSELKSICPSPSMSRRVIDVPTGHDGSLLWSDDFSFEMEWEPSAFSVPRNLGFQGRAGFVYKLAASDFRTCILPHGYHFISATPAVLPKKPYDLNFVTGCSLLPSWRKMVRDWVASSNFTPSAVEDVFVPFNSFELYRKISKLGALARLALPRPYNRCRTPLRMPPELGHFIEITDKLVAQDLPPPEPVL